MIKKLLVLLCAVFALCAQSLNAQVTTSSMNGQITAAGEPLIGATVVATHEPSGTNYAAVANAEGRFNLQGMRSGGPYKVEFAFIGYKTVELNGVSLELGNATTVNMAMEEDSQMLGEVVVVSSGSNFKGVKTGNSTNISSSQMDRLPSVNRSLSDFTRLSPYAGGNNSFGGMDGRTNTFTVDGANLNNNFGLAGGALPGGGNPISLDAIEEVQVSIAPFDVRQTSFIGAGVNAITKSGTNQVKATAYTFMQNEDLRGNSIDGQDLGARPLELQNTYGFTVGAPIVKNKLFIFVNGEYTKSPKVITKWRTSTDGIADEENFISRVTEEDMAEFAAILREKYGYEPGTINDFNSEIANYKALVRIDWNINDANKLSARYNFTKNINSWGLNNGMPAPYTPSGHGNHQSLYFSNCGYSMNNLLNSFTAELNSTFSDKVSNQILATLTKVDDVRTSESDPFPLIDILKDGDMFMSAGHELFSYNNRLVNDTFTITDNVSINVNKHAITAGLSFEYQNIANSFMPYALGYYRYESLESFKNDEAPILYAATYGYEGDKHPSADIVFGQASAYAQDIFSPRENLKVTYGVRIDVPMYLNDIYENKAITDATFANGEKVQTGKWPVSRPLVSPRVGWNWDVNGDHSLVVRGGTGIFTGRVPFIFFTNMPNNSGMIQNSVIISNPNDLANLAGGVKDVEGVQALLPNLLPSSAAQRLPGTIASVSQDFKLPQIWKTSIAADFELPFSFPATLSVEGMYTKNVNAVHIHDANTISVDDSRVTTFNGPDNRYMYPSDAKVYDEVSGAYVIGNTNKGHSYTFNTTLNMRPINNMQLMVAYVGAYTQELSSNPGSMPAEMVNNRPTVNGVNNLTLQCSQNLTPHKVVASISYKLDYLKENMSTLFGLYYAGYNCANASYVYANDMNGDGVKNDLMYIPASKDELKFVDTADFTAAQQAEAFWAYVNQDSYLSKHKGGYAGAYETRLPWINRFDLKVAQNFNFNVGQKTNTIQVSVDLMNAGNLLNDKWGVNQKLGYNAGKVLSYQGVDGDNVPTYTMYSYKQDGKAVLPTESYIYNRNSNECWQLQIGLKYIF